MNSKSFYHFIFFLSDFLYLKMSPFQIVTPFSTTQISRATWLSNLKS